MAKVSKKKKRNVSIRRRRNVKGSTEAFARFSNMTTTESAPANDGSTKVFSKVTSANQIGDQATSGDVFRAIKNISASTDMYFAETQVKANATATSWKLAAGESFVFLGPAGVGWKGDVYVKGDAAGLLQVMSF